MQSRSDTSCFETERLKFKVAKFYAVCAAKIARSELGFALYFATFPPQNSTHSQPRFASCSAAHKILLARREAVLNFIRAAVYKRSALVDYISYSARPSQLLCRKLNPIYDLTAMKF